MTTKEAFHKLIDTIADEKLLAEYYLLVKQLSDNQTGKLWDTLLAEEQQEVLQAADESKKAANLVDHEDVKKQFRQWPEK